MTEKITIEVEKEILQQAKEVLNEYGMNLSETIAIFLNKIKNKELPIEIENTPKEKIVKDLKEAIKEVKLAEEGKIKLKTLDEVLSEL